MFNETIYRPTEKGNDLFNVISAGVSLCDETYNISRTNSSMYIFVSVVAKQIKDYLDKNINEPISLTEISKSVYRSPSQVIRSFKKAYGVTPYQYTTEERLKTAKMLLTNHSYLTIKEVAFQLNFADEHYFSNYFKSKTGMSPIQYRKQKI